MFVGENKAWQNHAPFQVHHLGVWSSQCQNLGVGSQLDDFPVLNLHRLGNGTHLRIEAMVIHGDDLAVVEDHILRDLSCTPLVLTKTKVQTHKTMPIAFFFMACLSCSEEIS